MDLVAYERDGKIYKVTHTQSLAVEKLIKQKQAAQATKIIKSQAITVRSKESKEEKVAQPEPKAPTVQGLVSTRDVL